MLYDQLISTPFGQAVLTALVSMLPVVEIRGGLPYGVSLGLPWYYSLAASVVGNMLPVPLIVLFVRPFFNWLRRKTKLGELIERIERRAFKKAETVRRYELLGLFILVAIPLPGTGAWTGSLIAALLDLRLKRSFPAIFLGVVAAGIAVALITHVFLLFV